MCRFVYICALYASLTSGMAVNSLTSIHKTTGVSDCRNQYCGKVSYKEILTTYRGTLYTLDETYRLEILHKLNRERNFEQQQMAEINNVLSRPGDGDACCATEFKYHTNQTMVNIYGQTRIIIHMMDATPPRYQHIPHGNCIKYGKCGGKCFLEPLLLSLLVYEPTANYWPPLTFDWFEVPGYCSCKNVGTVSNLHYSLEDTRI